VEGEVGTQIQDQGGVYTLVHGSAMCAGCTGTGTSTSTGSGAGVVITFITVQTAANLPLGNPELNGTESSTRSSFPQLLWQRLSR